MESPEARKEIKGLISITIATIGMVIIILIAGSLLVASNLTFNYRATEEPFPSYEEDSLSATRVDILEVTRREYEKPQSALEYSDGVDEAWCADFVSWVYYTAGHKFTNPFSSGWRIPGVQTLKEYFIEQKRWHEKSAGGVPQPGDVIIYNGGIFGEHTNIVVSTYYDELITIGGNENGKIMMHRIDYNDSRYGIQGYGSAE